MSTNARSTRTTVASLATEFRTFAAAQQEHNAAVTAILASLTDAAPAVTAKPSPAKKAPAKKAPKKAAPKVTKGAQTRETLSRKDWNRTLTAKARLGGRLVGGQSVYSAVVADWAFVTGLRNEGMTPDEALAYFIA